MRSYSDKKKKKKKDWWHKSLLWSSFRQMNREQFLMSAVSLWVQFLMSTVPYECCSPPHLTKLWYDHSADNKRPCCKCNVISETWPTLSGAMLCLHYPMEFSVLSTGNFTENRDRKMMTILYFVTFRKSLKFIFDHWNSFYCLFCFQLFVLTMWPIMAPNQNHL